MGNSKGRAVYEANLPSDYRRPTSDQAMEAFINVIPFIIISIYLSS